MVSMKPATTLTILVLLLSTLLAGCVSDDPVDAQDGDDQVDPEEGLGSVAGRILTINLDPVSGARVQLVQDAQAVAETTTDEEGRYLIRNVEPAEYRFHVNAPCCKQAVGLIEVEPDNLVTKDLQLEVLSDDELQIPRVERLEWTGFLACTFRFPNPDGPHHDVNVFGVPGGVSGVNACGLVDVVSYDILEYGNLTDDDFLHEFTVKPGLKSIVGGMDWRAPGSALGDQLSLTMEVAGRPNVPPRYVDVSGTAPLEFRADDGYVLENYEEEDDEGTNIHQYDFQNIDDELELMYRVFAGGDANIVYQQQITIYWDLYYWEGAPETATALPDR